MGVVRRRGRTAVSRNGRRYSVCGPLSRRPVDVRMSAKRPGFGFLPGATLIFLALFSVFLLRWPPRPPDDPQRRAPIAAVAHFTIDDFANANR